MDLTPRERELLDLIRAAPLTTPGELARRLGTTRAAVNVHVSNLMKKGALLGRGYMLADALPQKVVVVGGANMDLKARVRGEAVPGTSMPGVTSQSPGGVARNVAENLARLGVSAALVSVVGLDSLGDALLRETAAAGVDVSGVLRVPGAATGSYTAVLSADGELLLAVAAMDVMEHLTPAALRGLRASWRGAAWVVADGNLPADTLTALLGLAAETGVRVVYEPVSVPKAARLRSALAAGHMPDALTPNLAELAALVGREVADDPQAIREAALELHAGGAELVWVRRGERGSVLSLPAEVHELPALPADVVDVTGAGDAMLAAFLAGLVAGQSPLEAAREGHAAAALTVESPLTVVPDLSRSALQARLSSSRLASRAVLRIT